MKRFILFGFAFTLSVYASAQVTVSGSIGADGFYSSLTNATGAFSAINGMAQNMATIVITITGDITTEDGSNSLNAGAWASLSIKPDAAIVRTVSGNSSNGLIRFNASMHVIADGTFGGTGQYLTFTNTSTAGPVFAFINGASNISLQNINITGRNTGTTGLVLFSTSAGSTGNNNNVINNCNIGSDGSNYPANLVYSAGTAGKANTNNTISNSNLYNYRGGSCSAINLGAGNRDWSITGNNIYQTTGYAGIAGTTYGIYINNTDAPVLINNYIGGSAPACSGNPWSISSSSVNNRFVGIFLSIDTALAFHNNTIKNFSWLSSGTNLSVPGTWCGIYFVSGYSGDTAGNIIGSATGTGSVTVTNATTNTYSFGIVDASPNILNTEGNILGSITLTGTVTGNTHDFYAIYVTDTTATITMKLIKNNLVGSLTTANSINAANLSTSSAKQFINCIHSNFKGLTMIQNNTVCNINNNYNTIPTAAWGAMIYGIYTSGGGNIITGNTIRNLTAQTTSVLGGTGLNASLTGIAVNAPSGGTQVISGNSIYSLYNSYTGQNSINGIYLNIPAAVNNIVARNLVHSLDLGSTSTASSLNGIFVNGGNTTFQNNMIRLGLKSDGSSVTTGYIISGINDMLGTNKYYFNSVYIGGTGVSTSTSSTFAFNSSVTVSSRIFENNIFFNARSNGSGTGNHYAVRLAGTTINPPGLTINYNDYFVSGTGGVLGLFNGTNVTGISLWRTTVGQDQHSFFENPSFMAAGAAVPDLHLNNSGTPCEGTGLLISSVTDDFDGETRAALTPTDIGADAGNFIFVGIKSPEPIASNLVLYPNPASEKLCVNTGRDGRIPGSIKIYNLLGQLCMETRHCDQVMEKGIFVGLLKPGSYILEIGFNDERVSRLFTISR